MAKPVLSKIWAAFPDHEAYPTLRDLYTHLGWNAARNIQTPGFGPNGNTCASRLSMAFNGGGAPITQVIAQSVGAETLGAGDGSRIIFRVTEFRKYLIRVLGKPLIDNASPYDSAFRGKRGIVAFTVNWGDASGHIALWNGAIIANLVTTIMRPTRAAMSAPREVNSGSWHNARGDRFGDTANGLRGAGGCTNQ